MRPLQEKIVIEQKSLAFQASRSMLYFELRCGEKQGRIAPAGKARSAFVGLSASRRRPLSFGPRQARRIDNRRRDGLAASAADDASHNALASRFQALEQKPPCGGLCF